MAKAQCREPSNHVCDRNTVQWQKEKPHSAALATQPRDRSDMTYICNFRVQELHSINMGAVLRQDMAQLLKIHTVLGRGSLLQTNLLPGREGWRERGGELFGLLILLGGLRSNASIKADKWEDYGL